MYSAKLEGFALYKQAPVGPLQNPFKQTAFPKSRIPSTRHAAKIRMKAVSAGLPATLTATEWRRCLTWWGYTCAYCGTALSYEDESKRPTADHYIPLARRDICPGSVATNILPTCSHCNHSKDNLTAEAWMGVQFGQAIAVERLATINAYFDYLRTLE